MSCYIVMSLVANQLEDAKKLVARAEELLKELDPMEEQGVRFELDSSHNGISYAPETSEQWNLAFKVIEGVVATFPEMKLRYYETFDGPLSQAGVSKNGELVEIELWETIVHLENHEDYQRVQAYLQELPEVKLELWPERLSLGWEFDLLTENELNDSRLKDISEHFPDMTIRCFKYDVAQEEHGDIVLSLSYSIVRNGKIDWTKCSPELSELLNYFATRNVDGISSYEDILFHSEQIPQAIKDEAHADAQPEDYDEKPMPF